MNKFAGMAVAAVLSASAWSAETNSVPAKAAESSAAELETRTFVLKYAKATEVADSLNRLCEKLKLTEAAVAFPESHSVAVAGPEHVVAACEKIVSDIDRKPKQVYVEARFFDLMASDMGGVGVDWSMLASGTIPGANPLTVAGDGEVGVEGGRGLSDMWKYTGKIGVENLRVARRPCGQTATDGSSPIRASSSRVARRPSSTSRRSVRTSSSPPSGRRATTVTTSTSTPS